MSRATAWLLGVVLSLFASVAWADTCNKAAACVWEVPPKAGADAQADCAAAQAAAVSSGAEVASSCHATGSNAAANGPVNINGTDYNHDNAVCGNWFGQWSCWFYKDPPPACEALDDKYNDPGSPDYDSGTGKVTVEGTSRCISGCAMEPSGATTTWNIAGVTFTSAHWRYSGLTCSNPSGAPPPTAPPPPPAEPACKAAANGQTYCVTQDGKDCYTASTGRMICWGTGETGTKTDGNVAQQKSPGTTQPAVPPAPAGETLSASGPDSQGTATTTNSSGATTSSSTWNTQNYTTQYGTDAGTSNSGQPQGSASGGSGDQGSGHGTVGGSGNCDAPYSVTGGDPVANTTLVELQKQRCDGEAAAKQGKTDAESKAATKDAEFTGTEQAQKDSMWSDGTLPTTRYGSGGVSSSAYGGGESGAVCPNLAINLGEIGTFNLPPKFCDVGVWLRWLFVLTAYVAALRWIAK